MAKIIRFRVFFFVIVLVCQPLFMSYISIPDKLLRKMESMRNDIANQSNSFNIFIVEQVPLQFFRNSSKSINFIKNTIEIKNSNAFFPLPSIFSTEKKNYIRTNDFVKSINGQL